MTSDDPPDEDGIRPASRPHLRVVSSREGDTAVEPPDDGLRRLLRTPQRPPSDDEDDDPGPSAA